MLSRLKLLNWPGALRQLRVWQCWPIRQRIPARLLSRVGYQTRQKIRNTCHIFCRVPDRCRYRWGLVLPSQFHTHNQPPPLSPTNPLIVRILSQMITLNGCYASKVWTLTALHLMRTRAVTEERASHKMNAGLLSRTSHIVWSDLNWLKTQFYSYVQVSKQQPIHPTSAVWWVQESTNLSSWRILPWVCIAICWFLWQMKSYPFCLYLFRLKIEYRRHIFKYIIFRVSAWCKSRWGQVNNRFGLNIL